MASRSLNEAIDELNQTNPKNLSQKWFDIDANKDLAIEREAFCRKHIPVIMDYGRELRFDANLPGTMAGAKALKLQAAEALAPLLEALETDPQFFENNTNYIQLTRILDNAVTPGTSVYSEYYKERLKLAAEGLAELAAKHGRSSMDSLQVNNFLQNHQSALQCYISELDQRAAQNSHIPSLKILQFRSQMMRDAVNEFSRTKEAFIKTQSARKLGDYLREATDSSTIYHSRLNQTGISAAHKAYAELLQAAEKAQGRSIP